jgi:hypothetical protein
MISALKVMNCTLRQDARQLSVVPLFAVASSPFPYLSYGLRVLHMYSRTQPPFGYPGHLIVLLEVPTEAFFNISESIVCDPKIERICSSTCRTTLSQFLNRCAQCSGYFGPD